MSDHSTTTLSRLSGSTIVWLATGTILCATTVKSALSGNFANAAFSLLAAGLTTASAVRGMYLVRSISHEHTVK
jgi:hypothetical protein